MNVLLRIKNYVHVQYCKIYKRACSGCTVLIRYINIIDKFSNLFELALTEMSVINNKILNG